MIVFLEGKVSQIDVLSVIIEIHGIGYHVNVPLNVSCKLPPIGQSIRLQIYPVYREDRRDLYGFLSQEERDFFKLIVEKVSGIGPRTALNIMSKLSLPILKDAIFSKNSEILSKCHGIGKKTAERIIMELSDKDAVTVSIKPSSTKFSPNAITNNISDAMSALISLGYKPGDAEKAIRQAMEKLGEDSSTESIIRSALGS